MPERALDGEVARLACELRDHARRGSVLGLHAIASSLDRSAGCEGVRAALDDADENGDTALSLAAAYGHPSIVIDLLHHGARVHQVYRGHPGTPLALLNAAAAGHLPCVVILHREHMHIYPDMVNTPFPPGAMYEGHTALSVACMRGHFMVVCDLLNECPQANVYGGPYHGAALLESSGRGFAHIVAELLSHGCDANCHTVSGRRSALQLAVAGEHWPVCALLAAFGADLAPLQDPIHIREVLACSIAGAFDDSVEVLLAHAQDTGPGFDIDAPLLAGDTLLTTAVSCANVISMQLLLQHNALPDAQDQLHRTALFIAAGAGLSSAVQVLLASGASPDIRAGSPVPQLPLSVAVLGWLNSIHTLPSPSAQQDVSTPFSRKTHRISAETEEQLGSSHAPAEGSCYVPQVWPMYDLPLQKQDDSFMSDECHYIPPQPQQTPDPACSHAPKPPHQPLQRKFWKQFCSGQLSTPLARPGHTGPLEQSERSGIKCCGWPGTLKQKPSMQSTAYIPTVPHPTQSSSQLLILPEVKPQRHIKLWRRFRTWFRRDTDSWKTRINGIHELQSGTICGTSEETSSDIGTVLSTVNPAKPSYMEEQPDSSLCSMCDGSTIRDNEAFLTSCDSTEVHIPIVTIESALCTAESHVHEPGMHDEMECESHSPVALVTEAQAQDVPDDACGARGCEEDDVEVHTQKIEDSSVLQNSQYLLLQESRIPRAPRAPTGSTKGCTSGDPQTGEAYHPSPSTSSTGSTDSTALSTSFALPGPPAFYLKAKTFTSNAMSMQNMGPSGMDVAPANATPMRTESSAEVPQRAPPRTWSPCTLLPSAPELDTPHRCPVRPCRSPGVPSKIPNGSGKSCPCSAGLTDHALCDSSRDSSQKCSGALAESAVQLKGEGVEHRKVRKLKFRADGDLGYISTLKTLLPVTKAAYSDVAHEHWQRFVEHGIFSPTEMQSLTDAAAY